MVSLLVGGDTDVVENVTGTQLGLARREPLGEEKNGISDTPTHQPSGSTSNLNQGMVGDLVRGVDQLEDCSYDVNGVCGQHGKGKNVWAKGKNGISAWRYSKTFYYTCR